MTGLISHLGEVGPLLSSAAIIVAAGTFLVGKDIQNIAATIAGFGRVLYYLSAGGALVLGPIALLLSLTYTLVNNDNLFLWAIYCLAAATVLILLFFSFITLRRLRITTNRQLMLPLTRPPFERPYIIMYEKDLRV